MSFAGHVLDMIGRSKVNRDRLLAARENRKQQMENQVKHAKSSALADKQISVEELEKVKSEIRAQAKRDMRQRVMWLVIIFAALAAILILFLA